MGKQRQLSLLSNTTVLYVFLKKIISVCPVDLPILIFTVELILLFEEETVLGSFYNLKSKFYSLSVVLAFIIFLVCFEHEGACRKENLKNKWAYNDYLIKPSISFWLKKCKGFISQKLENHLYYQTSVQTPLIYVPFTKRDSFKFGWV